MTNRIWRAVGERVSGLNDPHKTILFRHKELVALEVRDRSAWRVFFVDRLA